MLGKWTGFIALALAAWMFSAGHAATHHAVATNTIVQAGSIHGDRSGHDKAGGSLQELTADEDWPDLDCQGSVVAPRASGYYSNSCRLEPRTMVMAVHSGRPLPLDRPPDLLSRHAARA
ncbi:MAG: hypothetical protein ACRCVA_09940 [Phreatobacter sp.]